MKKKIYIKGMSCKNCVMHVVDALEEIDGVESVEVNLEGNCGEVNLSKEIDENVFCHVINDIGYEVVKIEGSLL